MPKDREKKPNSHPVQEGEQYTLESILAEFGQPQSPPDHSPAGPVYTPEDVAQDRQEKQEEAFFFPQKPKKEPEPPKAGIVTPFPGTPSQPEAEGEEEEPTRPIPIRREEAPPPAPEPVEEEPEEPTRILSFPTPEPTGMDKLWKKADDFAQHMYEDEGVEKAKAVRRAERLIPGVDEEAPSPPPVRERKPRKAPPPPPDLSPVDLFKVYSRGFKSFRVRTSLVLLLLLPMIYLTLGWPLPPVPEALAVLSPYHLRCYALAILQAVALLTAVDVMADSLVRPFRGRTSMTTLCALANLAALADALTLPTLWKGGVERLPFCGVAVLSLFCAMWGDLQKRRGQRTACRTAASAAKPYLVTRDEGKWNNRDTYVKWSGTPDGFGSQLQSPDGAERIYRRMTPLLILACMLFSLLSSVGRDRGGDFLWCLAATCTAACPLSGTICFGLPWRKMCQRLTRMGAALAGWPGVVKTTGSSNLLLTDIDLFPAGSVTVNNITFYGDVSEERIIGLAASVIRESGSGLDKVFHDLLRSHGAVYHRGELFTAYEGGGFSQVFGRDLVQVGSASFMALMDVPLPPGVMVQNAVFCAVNGELAGMFALDYQLPGTVLPALEILIRNQITPVLCTRDFHLIPSILRHRHKLPAEKMEFPPVERRRELSDPQQSHSSTLSAVLCREGVGPYAEAVVGARRLRSAVRMSAALACLGGIVGALLAFYLTYVGAYASLTPANLMLFLIMWLVPAPLISGWADRY